MGFGIKEIALAGVLGAMMAGAYVLKFKVSDARQQTLREDTKAKQKALADMQQATAGIDDLNAKIAKLQKAIEFFESKLPQEKEMDKILREVAQKAEANSLTTKMVKTLKSERFTRYSELPIEMTLAGNFNGFYAFLLELEKMQRITRLTKMKLERAADKDGEMQASLTLSIFFEPDSAPSRAVAGAQ